MRISDIGSGRSGVEKENPITVFSNEALRILRESVESSADSYQQVLAVELRFSLRSFYCFIHDLILIVEVQLLLANYARKSNLREEGFRARSGSHLKYLNS